MKRVLLWSETIFALWIHTTRPTHTHVIVCVCLCVWWRNFERILSFRLTTNVNAEMRGRTERVVCGWCVCEIWRDAWHILCITRFSSGAPALVRTFRVLKLAQSCCVAYWNVTHTISVVFCAEKHKTNRRLVEKSRHFPTHHQTTKWTTRTSLKRNGYNGLGICVSWRRPKCEKVCVSFEYDIKMDFPIRFDTLLFVGAFFHLKTVLWVCGLWVWQNCFSAEISCCFDWVKCAKSNFYIVGTFF